MEDKYPSGKPEILIQNPDDVFAYVGELGAFQIRLLAILSLLILAGGYPVLIMFFAGHNPPWKCLSNTTCTINGTFSPGDTHYKDRCAMPRSAWEFTKPKEYSIVTQFDLYCDNEGLIYLTTSVFFIGWGIGAIVLGWLADRYGRWKVLLASFLAIITFGFASAFSPTYAIFAIFRFIIGFFKPGITLGCFLLAGELVGPRWRPFSGTIVFLLFSVALAMMGVKAYFVREWKTLLIICSAPYSVFLISFLFIPESIRWLRLHGHNDKALDILRKTAKVNKKEFPEELKFAPIECERGNTEVGWKDIFWPKKMLYKSLIQGYAWFVNALVYYGVAFAADDLGGSMYRDYILASIVEIPAVIFAIYSQHRFGRKKTVIYAMIIGSIAVIIVSPIPAKGASHWKILRIILGMTGKFCLTTSFDSIYMWSLELYPTSIRAQGMGFLQITSRIGSAVAPWVAKWLILFHVMLPFSLMGVTAFLAAFLLMYLPETKDKPTLETLDDIDKDITVKVDNGILLETNHLMESNEDNSIL